MCIFTSRIGHVSNTKIFVRRTHDALQHLVYSMSLKSLGETAMVLPLPIADAATEIEFIDLSSHPQFFDDLRRAILKENRVHITYGFESQIPVQTVGTWHASFVPNRNDFSRLDQQFQLRSSILETLPYDCTWGFAVFQLRESLDTQAFHPFGLTFQGRSDFPLYFPTMHVHDGKVDETAKYDHELFMQADRPANPASFPEGVVDDTPKDEGWIDASSYHTSFSRH